MLEKKARKYTLYIRHDAISLYFRVDASINSKYNDSLNRNGIEHYVYIQI